MTLAPVVVCRIAWMDHYRGVTAADTPKGGGAFVKDKGFGHEAFNFDPYRGRFFGFVQATGAGVNLSRLGCRADVNSLDGVTVAWVATHPLEGGTRVVGWYESATVFSSYQRSPTPKRRLPDGSAAGYLATATHATILGRDARWHEVPRGSATQSGMGQSNIWYPSSDDANRLLRFITEFGSSTPSVLADSGGGTKLADVDRRQRIERTAMATTAEWFVKHGFQVTDVSMQQLGWDLEARRGRGCLRLEVKGTSLDSASFAVEVTPNEYLNMRDPARRPIYRLCVVSDCESSPTLETFAWSAERQAWSTDDGARKLILDEVLGARLRGANGPILYCPSTLT